MKEPPNLIKITNTDNEDWKTHHSYRSYWDLYAEILAVCHKHMQTISSIIQLTHQKYIAVRKQIDFLLQKGLLEEKGQEIKTICYYRTSPVGIAYLQKYLDLWNHVFENRN